MIDYIPTFQTREDNKWTNNAHQSYHPWPWSRSPWPTSDSKISTRQSPCNKLGCLTAACLPTYHVLNLEAVLNAPDKPRLLVNLTLPSTSTQLLHLYAHQTVPGCHPGEWCSRSDLLNNQYKRAIETNSIFSTYDCFHLHTVHKFALQIINFSISPSQPPNSSLLIC